MRDKVRWAEYGDWGGGACSVMAELLPLDEAGGCYVAADGHHIAHVWNVLPSGRFIDTTADQFRDGPDIRIFQLPHPKYVHNCNCWG